MIDQNELPEGTDSIVTDSASTGTAVTSDNEEGLTVTEPTKRAKVLEQVKTGGNKLAGQAADKTRGLVGQGLERSSEALASVSKLVGDTAAGIDERLGAEYGDYARSAATAIRFDRPETATARFAWSAAMPSRTTSAALATFVANSALLPSPATAARTAVSATPSSTR